MNAGVSNDLGPMVYVQKTGPMELQFFDEDTLVFACTLDVIAFDVAHHDASVITEGICDWAFDNDQPMLTGVARFITVPKRFFEVSTGTPGILAVQPLSDRSIYVYGQSPDTTVVITLAEKGRVIDQCPFTVQDGAAYFAKHGIEEGRLCKDRDGLSIRLAPGEATRMVFDKPGFLEVSVADPDIVTVTPLSRTGLELKAVKPGTTNVMTLGERAAFHHECMISVQLPSPKATSPH